MPRLFFGNRAYLIRAASATAVSIEGEASLRLYQWAPDAYNLVGFSLLGGLEPAFAQFFGPAGSKHPVNLIMKLNPADGSWTPVADEERIAANAADWVYAAADFAVIRVNLPNGLELVHLLRDPSARISIPALKRRPRRKPRGCGSATSCLTGFRSACRTRRTRTATNPCSPARRRASSCASMPPATPRC